MAEPSKISVDELQLDPQNARRRTERSKAVLGNSIAEFGAARSIVVDADGIVRAGNGTIEAARAAGITDTIVVESDGTKLVVVKRTDLRGINATAYAIADNRSGDLSEWDVRKLEEQLDDLTAVGVDIGSLGFSSDDIADMFTDLGLDDPVEEPEAEGAEPDIARADELQEQWNVSSGHVWLIEGQMTHRLICGSAADVGPVAMVLDGRKANLAFTSPPYAEQREYDPDSGFKPIHPDDYCDWFAPIAKNVWDNLADDGSWFINIKPDSDQLDTTLYVFDLVIAHVRKWGWHFATEFCWQRTGVPKTVSRRFKNQFEPVYQFAKGDWKFRPDNVKHPSDRVCQPLGPGAGNTNVSAHQGMPNSSQPLEQCEIESGMAYPGNRLPVFQSEALGHPAAFPVGLPRFFIDAYTDPGDVVFEPFSGSGSTFVAAEHAGRQCCGTEISPKYCALILQRMTDIGCECRLAEPTGNSRKD